MKLKEIQSPVSSLLEKTDKIIGGVIGSRIPLVNDVTGLIPLKKGKKIRSTLLFLLAGLSGDQGDNLSEIAASVELFHISSLIHDDILDNAELRRGEKTLNNNFGNLISVLGGDFLFVNSIEHMNRIEDKAFLGMLIRATKEMVEGQLLEIQNNYNYNLDEKTYMEIIEKKTSSLFAGVTKMAAHSSGIKSSASDNFYNFGINFGNIFQMSDDILDIYSTNSGKERFTDLREGKITLPYIILIEKNGEGITDLFSIEKSPELFEEIKKAGIIDEMNVRIDDHYSRCLKFIESFPVSVYSKSLINLLEFIRKREY